MDDWSGVRDGGREAEAVYSEDAARTTHDRGSYGAAYRCPDDGRTFRDADCNADCIAFRDADRGADADSNRPAFSPAADSGYNSAAYSSPEDGRTFRYADCIAD